MQFKDILSYRNNSLQKPNWVGKHSNYKNSSNFFRKMELYYFSHALYNRQHNIF